MGQRTSYEPGTFNFVELATPDPESAAAFYAAIFRWERRDVPMPDEAGGGIYLAMHVDGDVVAGLYQQGSEEQALGVPPSWLSYVAVSDVDATVARALELGGALVVSSFDVVEAGRLAVIADPAGAAFGIWQAAGDSIGATRVNDPGCLTSNELSTNDMPGAIAFYTGLFGWQIDEVDTRGGPRYWLINHAGATKGRNGGMRELAPEQAGAPNWMPYFTVGSTDGTIARATELGGGLVAGPMEIPAGRIAIVNDPQGAIFGTFEGAVDD